MRASGSLLSARAATGADGDMSPPRRADESSAMPPSALPEASLAARAVLSMSTTIVWAVTARRRIQYQVARRSATRTRTAPRFPKTPRIDTRSWTGSCSCRPRPRVRHQRAVGKLYRALSSVVHRHDVGEVLPGLVTVRLHDELVLEPDLIFVRSDRLGIIDPEGSVDGPPDLVVEVLSPSNRAYDRT